MYYIQETTSPKICRPRSLLLDFYRAHSHDLSGHPGRKKITQQSRKTTIFQTLIDG